MENVFHLVKLLISQFVTIVDVKMLIKIIPVTSLKINQKKKKILLQKIKNKNLNPKESIAQRIRIESKIQ